MTDNILRSPFKSIPPTKFKTVPEYLLNKAKTHTQNGKTDWLIDGLTDERRSYRHFNEETGKIASKFYKQGLRKGDFVHYMITDMIKLHTLTNGVWRSNGYLRVSYPEDDEETVLKRVDQVKSRWMICDQQAANLCLSVAKKCEWEILVVVVDTEGGNLPSGCISFYEYLNDDGSEIPEFELTENDTAIILCTSGTTGPSKGAVITHKALLMNIRLLSRFPFTTSKPNIIASKGVHISGTTLPLVMLAAGKTGIVLSRINTNILMEVVQKYKPGLVYGFTSYVLGLCRPEARGYDFSSVEIIFSGGTPITPSIKQILMTLPNVRDIVIMYGLTEHLLGSVNVDFNENAPNPSIRETPDFSAGKPPPGVSIQIRDVDNDKILGPNQKGEICVKSDCEFKEYFGSPESTANAFTDDGYIRSGDLGHYDENGFLFITDRQKEIFKYFNNHISPSEIESVIAQHFAVNEVCVIGVPDEGGQVPRAFVTLNETADDQIHLSKEIRDFANSKLSSYKQLRGGVYILKELPKGSSGKVARTLVQQLQIAS